MRVWSFLKILGIFLLVMALGRPADAADPIKIGFSMPKTGYLGIASPVASQAYELWREQVNANGGLSIGGKEKRPIIFVDYDDQSEPTKTAQIYEKLISQDRVDLLLAPYATPFHIAIAPVVERHKFPVVGDTALSTLMRDLKVKYMFMAEVLPDRYAKAISAFLKAQGITSTAILALQLPLSLETKKYLLPALESDGIKVVFDNEYPMDIKDMTGMLSSLKAAKPQAVLGLTYPQDSILYVNTARELGVDAEMQLLMIAPAEPWFVQKFPAQVSDGFVTIGHWSPSAERWPKAKAFFDAYVAKWHEPPDYLDSVISYAACEILEQAVAKVGLDHEKLREVLASDTFDTINGPIKFTNGENLSTPAGLLQIQNGQMQLIWPREIATAKFQPKAPWSK
jgi:branched-chain amino acid transport system substrate-binding protein